MQQKIPIETLHLFPILDKLLIELLTSLTEDEWHAQTIAKRWKVKDVASHILDGNMRGISHSRDNFFGEKPENINSYQELVAFLNELNMSWTNATKRLSPKLLTFLLEITGKQYNEHLNTLPPFGKAVFSVAWAGQEVSENWFHIAREYTERFLHQQQIRDALGRQGLLTDELYYPFLDTFMYAMPHTYQQVPAEVGTVVTLKIINQIQAEWHLIKNEDKWELEKNTHKEASARVKIPADIAWKLFSKSLTPTEALPHIEMTGNEYLGKHALQMVSVMA